MSAARQRHPVRVLCSVLCSLATLSAWQRADAAQEPIAESNALKAVATAPEYRIGPGDLLNIAVSGLPDLRSTVRVSNSGKIHSPYLGIMRVADMTTRALETEIGKGLRERGLVNEPWVDVTIAQYRAQPVYILGEVELPGQYVIQDEMYLTDLITLSGGFNIHATPVGYLYRRLPDAASLAPDDSPVDQAIPIDFKALNEGIRPELNLRLQGGDVLYVPQRRQQQFYVVGDVRKPGKYPIEVDGPVLFASTALSQAGGPENTAKLSRGVLVRFGPDGSRQELPMDFDAILRGRKPDVTVQPNDILFVPGSKVKTLGYGLLGMIPFALAERTTQPR